MSMPYRLFSERLRDAERSGQTDVYQYDELPEPTRVQIRQLVERTYGTDQRHTTHWVNNPAATWAHEILTHAMGRDNFGISVKNAQRDLLGYFETAPVEQFINMLEVICVSFERKIGDDRFFRANWNTRLPVKNAIAQINFRLRDASFGYQYESGQIVRIDSQFLHAEVTKPALTLLSKAGFEGPQAEFLTAHDHYRAGRYKESINEAAKAFESLMRPCAIKRIGSTARGHVLVI